jgi:malate synthase
MTTVREETLTSQNPSPDAGPAPQWQPLADGVEIWAGAWTPAARELFTPSAVELVARLHRKLDGERRELLAARDSRQAAWDAGALPAHLYGPVSDRARGDWSIAPLPADLLERRVEITGPVNDTKMVINMLSRNDDGVRADAAMLDFEDSMMPSWGNVVRGLANLRGAADGSLRFVKPASGGQPEKVYRLDPDDMPLLMVRCRGLHLEESNLRIDGTPVAAAIVDLVMAASVSAAQLLASGRTPKYYVPKVEHHREAHWWNRLFRAIEEALELPWAALRATFLIETLPAALQIEEILYQLRERVAGLNVGRWDKIFSDIKVLKEHPDRVLADRATISLTRPWMRAYAESLIHICHRHGAFAMGGMAAFTPGATAERRSEQTAKVVEDKRFEAALGHDGCWVSHPYFIGPALAAFERSNQLDVVPDLPDPAELLPQGGGPRTLAGLRTNVRVGIAYTKGWKEEIGCVAWDDLMEDLATLEISRAQTWQWLRHAVLLDDGQTVTRELVERIFAEELAGIAAEIRAAVADEAIAERLIAAFTLACDDARGLFTEERFRPFLATRSPLAPPIGADATPPRDERREG